MPLDLNSIDLSAVDELARIKGEYDQVGARLKSMAERRDKVSAEVYQRVHDDYRKRLDELAQQSAPLKQRAGEVYRSLRNELAALEQSFSAASLDREEIDFRHALGEFDDAELKQRVKAVDARIGEAGKARAQALALKEKFLAVVAGESELEGSDDDTARMNAITPAQAEATIIAAPIKPAPADATTVIAPATIAAAAAAAPAAPTPPPQGPAPPMAPAAVVANTRAASRSSRNPDATVVFRQGRLEPRNPEAGSVVQTLGLKPVSIGSDGGCDLQLSSAGVAKRHLEIVMTRAGFSVRDVAASGQVKVNGNIVQEHVLADGDTLSVGPAQFNFRLL